MGTEIMVLLDGEEEYVQQMTDYLKKKEDFPYEIHAYMNPQKMAAFACGSKIALLVAAESAYTEEIRALSAEQVLILKEKEERGEDGELPQTDKYQSAENIYRCILEMYLEKLPARRYRPVRQGGGKMRARLVGLYSPVRRCLQTSFALSLGQALAGRHKTLYISFEQYAGWNGLLGREGGKDLSDLLYYLEEDSEKFRYRLRLVEKKTEGLFYIPPVFAGQNLVYITADQWIRLLDRIAEEGGYTYMILDLGEGLQGVFELLRMCDRIYTVACGDAPARGKVDQYERLLRVNEYEDILEKTRKYIHESPCIHESPGLDQFTKGELAAYVRKIIEEDLEREKDDTGR